MQTLTESVYKLGPPGGLFEETVIRNLFPDLSAGAQKLLLHRAVRKDEVLRLKPGLFCLAEDYRKSHPHPFVIASLLQAPSQISLESALSFHGLIPEAVYQVSSVGVQRSRTFKTPLGIFTFDRVPANSLRAGVKATEVDKNAWAFVATPLRALADLVYLNKEVRWQQDGLDFLTQSLRIEADDLREISMDGFEEVSQSIRNKRVKEYLAGLRKALGR